VNKLTIIFPTPAKLIEGKEIGLLSRWRFYFKEYSKNFKIELYSCDTKNFSKDLGIKHHPLPFSMNFIPYGNQILFNFYILAKAPFMSKVIRIIGVSYFLIPLIKILNKKIVLSFHYDYQKKTKSDFSGIKAMSAGMRQYLSIKSADLIISATEELKRKVKVSYDRESIVIPNFVDNTKFFPLEQKENYILYAGRIYWHKGIEYLLNSFANVEKKYNIQMKIAGLGDIEYYREKALKLGIKKIEFLGGIDNLEMPKVMGKAKIFVLPTLTLEGHPKALIEAMASGCACIATAVPGNKNLIDDGKNGLLVKPRDVNSLTEAITKVLNNEGLRVELGKNARLKATRFSVENTLKKEIYILKMLQNIS